MEPVLVLQNPDLPWNEQSVHKRECYGDKLSEILRHVDQKNMRVVCVCVCVCVSVGVPVCLCVCVWLTVCLTIGLCVWVCDSVCGKP
jgi:hypothetical protein